MCGIHVVSAWNSHGPFIVTNESVMFHTSFGAIYQQKMGEKSANALTQEAKFGTKGTFLQQAGIMQSGQNNETWLTAGLWMISFVMCIFRSGYCFRAS